MAITGKFLADFADFHAAVQKADVELRGMETGANKVGASLNRMADQFSGQKVIKDAELLTKAIHELGGASTLTEAEQAKVNRTVTEALAKYKALGQEAPPAMTALAAATQKVEAPTAQLNTRMVALGTAIGSFIGNIAASAVSNLGSAVLDLASTGAKLPAVQSSFQRLASGVGQDSAAMLSSLQTATRGMVANYDLMLGANKAMLLGLPVTADSMGELATAATALGKAMGQDATKSLDDLITALGRSSPMILDNLGLTVKVGEANDAYALKLGKTASQLTDVEKKMAFYEAAMEAARIKTAELGEQTKTLGEIGQTIWTSVSNVVTQTVADVNEGLGAQISALGRLIPKWHAYADATEEGAEAQKHWTDELIRGAREGLGPAAFLGLAQITQGMRNHAEVARQAADWQLAFNEVVKNAPKISESLRTPAPLQPVNMDDAIAWWDASTAAQKKLEEQTKRLAAAEKQRLDQMTGAAALESARVVAMDVSNAMSQRGIALAQMSRDTQASINKTMAEAIGVYKRAGKEIPADLMAIYIATADLSVLTKGLPGILPGVSSEYAKLGRVAIPTLQDLELEMNDVTKALKGMTFEMPKTREETQAAMRAAVGLDDAVGDLSKSLANLATVAGGTFGSIAGGFATMVGAFDAAKKGVDTFKSGLALAKSGDALAGIAGMATGIAGIVAAAVAAANAIKAIWGALDRNKGRDLVVDFAEGFGGFDALHKELLALGDAGEALWIKLTQGVGRNNPDQAAKVIAEVEAALAKQKAAQDAASVSTEAGAQATIETATQAALALEELNGKIALNADAWGEWSKTVTGYLSDLAASIRSLPLPGPGGATVPGTGTLPSGVTSRPGPSSTSGASGNRTAQPIIIQIDRRNFAEVMAETVLN